ncbi:efflux RND transporter periplasmic adaptor subunit [Ancylobacter vacuolatus]|uniref:Multidrug efflux system membrane fusion protein n=1 Tax=Ancylobacter vacuolatus TaxID=223389 RepID=A0ABU0DMN7_9HYPH|nr:efflux RND transporter periplasmic adaptor subunit [Ancylobacter vacuolatus]MDQ0349655.1 multidrug efflux system membrane fusion protein [Ancylobacter vacuolatus]
MTVMMRLRPSLILVLIAATAMVLVACSDGAVNPRSDAAEGRVEANVGAIRVSVLKVQPRQVVVYDELPGRVSARRTAEIRPQVNGIVRKVIFTEGAEVSADQPLFQIDPAPFAADVEAASAVLARAEADLVNATVKHERVTALAASQATSAAALGDAKAAQAQARASVAEARANVTRRELELSYATVRSPIAGRIGQALTTEGSLASVGASTALAVVQQIDSVYLDVRQSSIRREQLEERLDPGRSEHADVLPVGILTITGKPYEFPGKILFSDSTVDPGTGSIAMRVEVPNPHRQLLPGMYLRARVPSAIYPDALTVPQQAVRRDPSGQAQLTVIGSDNAAGIRDVELGPLVERQYVVLSGLRPGETVVVEGQDRTAAGQPLELVPYQRPSPKSES